jgi:hypothetical protein
MVVKVTVKFTLLHAFDNYTINRRPNCNINATNHYDECISLGLHKAHVHQCFF